MLVAGKERGTGNSSDEIEKWPGDMAPDEYR